MVEFEKNVSLDIRNEDERIIAGWASVEVKDLQGDVVPISEMIKAMMDYMDRGGLIMYGHSNKSVGKVLYWDVKKHPETGEYGVYIVAKINKGYKFEDEVWKRIREGVITGFSIGGHGERQPVVMKTTDGREEPVRLVKNLELFEISLVEEPANPYAKIVEYSLAKGVKIEDILKDMKIDVDAFFKEVEKIKNTEAFGSLVDTFRDLVAYEFFEKKYDELDEEGKYNVQKVFDAIAKILAVQMILDRSEEGYESVEEGVSKSDEEGVEKETKEEENNANENSEQENVDKMMHPTEIKTPKQILEETKEQFEGGMKILPEVERDLKEGEKPKTKRVRVLLDKYIDDMMAQIDSLIYKIRKSREEIKKECKDRYKDPNEPSRFKKMTCPDDSGGKTSRFCGCVRYFMNCEGRSLDSAKRICAYIARYVKKGLTEEDLPDEIRKNLDEILREIEKEVDDEEKFRRWISRMILLDDVGSSVGLSDNDTVEVDEGWEVPFGRVRGWAEAYRGLGGRGVFARIFDKIMNDEPLTDSEYMLLEYISEIINRYLEKELGTTSAMTGGEAYVNPTYGGEMYDERPRYKHKDVNKVSPKDKDKFMEEARKIVAEYTDDEKKIERALSMIWSRYARDGSDRMFTGIVPDLADLLNISGAEASKMFERIRKLVKDFEEGDVNKVAAKDKSEFIRRAKEILEKYPEKETDKAKIPALVEWMWTNYAESRKVDGQEVISRIADTLNIPAGKAAEAFGKIKRMIEELESKEEDANKSLFESVKSSLNKLNKQLVEILKPEDKRPPKEWLERKVRELMRNQGLDRESATRLAAWIYWHWMKPSKPRSKDEPDKPDTSEARRRKRQWLSERTKG